MDEINDATDRVIAGLEGRPLQAGGGWRFAAGISSLQVYTNRYKVSCSISIWHLSGIYMRYLDVMWYPRISKNGMGMIGSV